MPANDQANHAAPNFQLALELTSHVTPLTHENFESWRVKMDMALASSGYPTSETAKSRADGATETDKNVLTLMSLRMSDKIALWVSDYLRCKEASSLWDKLDESLSRRSSANFRFRALAHVYHSSLSADLDLYDAIIEQQGLLVEAEAIGLVDSNTANLPYCHVILNGMIEAGLVSMSVAMSCMQEGTTSPAGFLRALLMYQRGREQGLNARDSLAFGGYSPFGSNDLDDSEDEAVRFVMEKREQIEQEAEEMMLGVVSQFRNAERRSESAEAEKKAYDGEVDVKKEDGDNVEKEKESDGGQSAAHSKLEKKEKGQDGEKTGGADGKLEEGSEKEKNVGGKGQSDRTGGTAAKSDGSKVGEGGKGDKKRQAGATGIIQPPKKSKK